MKNNEQIEKNLIEYMVASPLAFSLCKTVIKPEYFMKEHAPIIKYLINYNEKYHDIPSVQQIEAETGVELQKPEDAERKFDWTCDEVEKHCRLHATIKAITDAADHIMSENYGGVVDPIKEAVLLSLHRDLGTIYAENPLERLKSMAVKDLQATGFKDIDDALFGGTMLGGINIVAANSGGGKSFFLANLAMNWIERGKNVVYISLELSEAYVCKRFDQMVSGFTAQDVMRNMEETSLKVKEYSRETGLLVVKYLPPQSKVQDIEAYLNELELKLGVKFDLVVVDYLDLVAPNDTNISMSDHFTKDKMVTEQLRSLMGEKNYHCWTASQLNREAVNSLAEGQKEHSQAHIAGGISKINTADVVATLATNASLKEHGLYRIQFLKTRASSGVGKVLCLGYDVDTMRMYDASDEQKEWFYKKSAPTQDKKKKINFQSDKIGEVRRLLKQRQEKEDGQ
jgi:replicative DNA helicase